MCLLKKSTFHNKQATFLGKKKAVLKTLESTCS